MSSTPDPDRSAHPAAGGHVLPEDDLRPCRKHREQLAVGYCDRCGLGICAHCLGAVEGIVTYCVTCTMALAGFDSSGRRERRRRYEDD